MEAIGRFEQLQYGMVANVCVCEDRSLLYVDADARMEVFTDAEGNKRSNLSLVARNFDVLSRARTDDVAETNDEGLVQEASS